MDKGHQTTLTDEEAGNALRQLKATGRLSYLDRIVQGFARFVYVKALRLTHDESLAQELTQEAFIKLATKYDSIVKVESLRAWLSTNVSNGYRVRIRSRKRDRVSAEEVRRFIYSEAQHLKDPFTLLQERETDNEKLRIAEELINDLPQQLKTLVELHFLRGLPINEVAFMMGVHVDTARHYRRRAIIQLAQAYKRLAKNYE